MKSRYLLFALCQLGALAVMAFAWFLVGGFKGQVAFPGQVLFFGIIGVSAALGFGSLLLFPRDSRSAQAWIPVVGLIITGAGSGILAPVFASARFAASKTQCLSSVKKTGHLHAFIHG